MSTQRQSVAKPVPAAAPSRAEAARPPKPTVESARPEAERSKAATRIDQVKKSWQDTVAELKKVTWPDKETTKNLTLVVIAISAVLGAFLGGLDWVLQQVFALI